MNAPGSPSSALQHDVFLVGLCCGGQLPLPAGGEAGAAAAAQAGILNDVE